jgi:hypothetical protein
VREAAALYGNGCVFTPGSVLDKSLNQWRFGVTDLIRCILFLFGRKFHISSDYSTEALNSANPRRKRLSNLRKFYRKHLQELRTS